MPNKSTKKSATKKNTSSRKTGIAKRRPEVGRAIASAAAGVIPSGSKSSALFSSGNQRWMFGVSSITFAEDLPFEDFRSLLTQLAGIKAKWHRYLASAIEFGCARYGEDEVATVLEQLQLPLDDVQRARAINALPELTRADPGLDSEQLHILARELKKAPPAEIAAWAELAKKSDLHGTLLTRSIQSGRVLTQEALDASTGKNSGGIPNAHAIVVQFTAWLRKLGGQAGIAKLTRPQRESLLNTFSEIATTLDTLRA